MISVAVISFDVWGTLLDTRRMFELIAEKLAERLSFREVDADTVERIILRVYERCKARRRLGEVDGFDIVVESQNLLAQELGITQEEVINAIEEAFSSADPNQIMYPEVASTIQLLNKLGFRMGVIGNTVFWSSRLTRELLDRLGLAKHFEVMLFADATRINKPDRRIFLMFAKHMDVEPSRVAHVGDSVIEDIGGALSAGMKAIYIDRGRRNKGKVVLKELGLAVISELSQVIDVLEEL
jgi:putative hydrolase of the HAD superfamily